MKNLKRVALCLGTAAVMASCAANKGNALSSGLNPDNFVDTVNGKPTALYTLRNANGMEVSITNFGGRIVSVMVPNSNDSLIDVVLGFDNVKTYADYKHTPSDFGAAIGRYANRIAQGKINVDGKEIQLPKNNFGHCLHGGPTGWQYQVYDVVETNDSTIKLAIDSPDGDNNFPGNVKASVTYTLTSNNAIDIKYEATTDKKTVINMTNHTYFNLSGDANNKILDNVLYVNADNYTPVDRTYMTTGEILPVKDTPMDFTTPKAVGQDIAKTDFDQIRNGNGYDHNWVLNTNGDIKAVAATLFCPSTGVELNVYTDEPGIQVYSGNFLDGTAPGKRGIKYAQRTGICLETQKYPDTPNKPQWPSAWLNPGETYSSHTIFAFSVKK